MHWIRETTGQGFGRILRSSWFGPSPDHQSAGVFSQALHPSQHSQHRRRGQAVGPRARGSPGFLVRAGGQRSQAEKEARAQRQPGLLGYSRGRLPGPAQRVPLPAEAVPRHAAQPEGRAGRLALALSNGVHHSERAAVQLGRDCQALRCREQQHRQLDVAYARRKRHEDVVFSEWVSPGSYEAQLGQSTISEILPPDVQ